MMILTLYPLYYIAVASLSHSDALVGHTGLLLKPLSFNVEAYRFVFQNPNIASGYRNTMLVVLGGTFVNLLMTSLGAYVLSRKQLYWKNHMMFLIAFTMFFSGGLIPTYLLVNNTLGLGNTLTALVVPTLISTWNLIVMRTSFAAIPESLIESAKLDGAHDFTVLFRIVIPLSMPVMAVMILFYGVAHWNAWFQAMIYLRDRNLYPLQLILREILIANSTDAMMTDVSSQDKSRIGESIKYATIMVATLPILIAYPFLQKYFVKGVMIGALKE
ncbi:carbohydrate ABC transporter permease [Paenibacillus sp. IB182496]|uniref:Carbohydrate ABC transporter permease n=2 Tax=Paenibacillus sabuli TaxID=2772509 RepID=A0A927GPT9_9BACL|nr:carbohydrate ABC transporter permease [Paenibacillus sabuli]